MNVDGNTQLVDELNHLLVVKLALVLVPTRRALQAIGWEGLALAIGKITCNLSADLESILSSYNISKRANHDESDDL
jgi:hypothetical protein